MVKRADLKHDRFYKEAKREGYRSRSAFKLLQISKKFTLIKAGDVVVDLGAAPGGWSQIARELVGEHGMVISVDLLSMTPIEGVAVIKGDITNEETITTIQEALASKERKTVDVVISDAAPQLSGNKDLDQFRSCELSTAALNVATELLKGNGNFVTKIFQGEYYPEFYKSVKEKFRSVKAYAPEASRKRSAEVYVVGKGYKQSLSSS
ncbi:MAG TPA: RlmE family RNA methyltransferase [Candidatus Bathyarchaeia archaeon]|nr:RlmE family RNA methyltransferase [Candidatus Bathyarchaeia archaeon]